MRKIALAALLPLFLVAACGDDDDDGDSSPSVNSPINGSIDPDDLQKVTIDGMPCIVYRDHRGSGQEYSYSGITCDWNAR